MMREARAGDEAAILAFLQPHLKTSMFLASNLLAHGLFEREHRQGTEYWIVEEGEEIQGIVSATSQGYFMAQCPDADDWVWQAFADRVKGREFNGMTGDPEQVGRAVSAFGIARERVALDALDPLMFLDLSALSDASEDIRAAEQSDIPLLTEWWREYFVDADLKSPDDPDLAVHAEMQATASVSEGRTRLLVHDGDIVSMSSINARVNVMVQMGGVFTPKPLRGRGYAGRVIAGHLAQERERGITQSILFAASDTATKAYEKIGFSQVGHYRLCLMKKPVRLGESS
ncbi:MAG: GNAT family N-acetyltransferase [Cognatishimia sp.]|nr:GNAT family N-acetyltransferase [Cognatishimia sp.]